MLVKYKNNIVSFVVCTFALWLLPYPFAVLIGVVLLLHHSAYEIVFLAFLLDIVALPHNSFPENFLMSTTLYAVVFFFLGKVFRSMLF